MLTADYFTCLFALGAKKGSTGIPFHAKEIRHLGIKRYLERKKQFISHC